MTRTPSPVPDALQVTTRPGATTLDLEEWIARLGRAILRVERLPVPAARPAPEDPAA